MSHTQPELDFSAQADDTAGADKQRLAARLADLCAVLREKGDWMTRRELESRGFEERELREIGEHDAEADIFSYPGSPGYKLTELVTEKEFDRCLALKSQIRKMARRFVRLLRRRRRLFHRQS